jgi:hypothetical protein
LETRQLEEASQLNNVSRGLKKENPAAEVQTDIDLMRVQVTFGDLKL